LTGFAGMNNPLRILQTLDGYLTRPAEITLFGRAALALGFKNAPAGFSATRDVDAILPLQWLAAPDENLDFWQAQQKTNAHLESEGLYITHLFRESEVILTPEWLKNRASISIGLKRLSVFRPSTIDLLLTKMMRGDENDLADIRFLLEQEKLSGNQLRVAFDRACVPDVPEIRELFQKAKPKVLAFAEKR
jgi:hypothetical protein